jgi:hypothetical protein
MTKNNYKSATGNMIKTGITNMVGIGMIGGVSQMANDLPCGTAGDNLVKMTPGFMSMALVGENVKTMNKSFGFKNTKTKSKPISKWK